MLFIPGEDSMMADMMRLAALSSSDGTQGTFPDRERVMQRTVGALLAMGEAYGLSGNLWHHAVTLFLLTHENPYTLSCERRTGDPAHHHSIRRFALEDMARFLQLFQGALPRWDGHTSFDPWEALTHYVPVSGPVPLARQVEAVSRQLAHAPDREAFCAVLTQWYEAHGAGQWGMYEGFRVETGTNGQLHLEPVAGAGGICLDDLIGYDGQKRQLRQNVEAFLRGRGANDMLLYGEAGTGKSTSVRALLQEFGSRGLRLVELYKHQFSFLPQIIRQLRDRNYHFVIFMDDLSFEENEVEYKYLKAVMEGGVANRPGHVMICATSNRRHLIRETWGDRADMAAVGDVHRSETQEEKLSLAARFGCQILYDAPDQGLYREMVREMARRQGTVPLEEAALQRMASAWEIRHGGRSGRAARQFVTQLMGDMLPENEKEMPEC